MYCPPLPVVWMGNWPGFNKSFGFALVPAVYMEGCSSSHTHSCCVPAMISLTRFSMDSIAFSYGMGWLFSIHSTMGFLPFILA